MTPYANHGELERAEQEIMNFRAQLRREQDARADLRVELDRMTTARDQAAVNAAEFMRQLSESRVRVMELTAERDQARRELVAAMQTIEAASIALGGVREQREQPGELEEVGDRG